MITIKTQEMMNDQQNDQQATTNKNDKNEKKFIGRSKKQTDPRVKEFLTYWGDFFLKETGQPYPFSFEKDGRVAKDLLKLYPLETLQEITKAFFKDEWCKSQGFTFGLFKSQFGKLLIKKTMNKATW